MDSKIKYGFKNNILIIYIWLNILVFIFQQKILILNRLQQKFLTHVAHAFVSTPIYDNFNIEIGYKCSDDYIQQVSEDKYLVRINNTYYINGKGSINWQYSFLNDTPSYFYPIGVLASSNITSTTGDYFGKSGAVALLPTEDGKRSVTIGFNFN